MAAIRLYEKEQYILVLPVPLTWDVTWKELYNLEPYTYRMYTYSV